MEINKEYSHLINFYVRDVNEAETIVKPITEKYSAVLLDAKITPRGNHKARLAVHKEDVCDIACILSKAGKNLFIFDYIELQEQSAETEQIRIKYYKTVRYMAEMLIDEGKTPSEIADMMKNGAFFEQQPMKQVYESLLKTNVSKDNAINMALFAHRDVRALVEKGTPEP